ncbi:MAG: cytochrome c biogenesis protein CcmE [Alphaproteobacteria bacterium]|nr:cytochrome c biogenesis protein CcmE [Alphaproteobacteria bacterium]
MRRRSQRLIVIGAVGAMLALAVGLILFGLRDSIVSFYAPSDLVAQASPGERVRIGGLVEDGSVGRAADGALLFTVFDNQGGRLRIRYQGEPPSLFRVNSGIVIEAVYQPGETLTATSLLARHDENYVPREVEEALKERGEWRGDR